MLSLKTSFLPLLLLLRPTVADKDHEDDRGTSPCIWTCLSNLAPGVNTFTCEYLTSNTALVSCINACPNRDVTNYLNQVLNLDCEGTLFHTRTSDDHTQTITGGPTATATDNDSGNRPTGSSDYTHSDDTHSDDKGGDRTKTDHKGHGGDDCHGGDNSCTKTKDDSSDDNTATRTGSNTVVMTATDEATIIAVTTTTGIVTVTTSRSGNVTRTTTTAPAGNTGAAALGFGVPGVGAVIMGVVAWAWVL